MRILLTLHQFFPQSCTGTEVLTLSVAHEMRLRGHDVRIFTGCLSPTRDRAGAVLDAYDYEDIRVHRFHHASFQSGGRESLMEMEFDNDEAAKTFARVLDHFKPDIVHFFHFQRLGTGLLERALALGIPCFYTPTDFWTVCPTIQLLLENNQTCAGPSKKGGNCALHMGMRSHNPVIARLSRMVPAAVADTIINVATRVPAFTGALGRDLAATGRRLRVNVSRLNRLNGIFSPTQFMTEILAVNGVNRRLIVESAYGLDTLARETPAVRSQCRRPFVFGFIGTLAPHKGCHLLIDAFRIFPTGYARLEIYGDPARFPEYHATLQQLASQAVGIEFRGTFPHTGLAGVLASIDALVVPSLWYENAPLIVSSALAARCPVIASDSPGLVALVRHNVNGLVFSPGDAIALRDAMLEITRSPDLYTNLSAGCEPQRSTSQYVEQLLAHYVSHCQLLNGVNGPAQTDTNKELHPQAQP